MFYFKRVQIENISGERIEAAIRNSCIRSVGNLDLTKSTSYIGTDKDFFGYESKDNLTITRIRGPIEKYFPKLIVKFSKQEGFVNYRIRYSLIPTIFLFAAVCYLASSMIDSINDSRYSMDMIIPCVVISIIILLTILEIRLTQIKINKQLKKLQEVVSFE